MARKRKKTAKKPPKRIRNKKRAVKKTAIKKAKKKRSLNLQKRPSVRRRKSVPFGGPFIPIGVQVRHQSPPEPKKQKPPKPKPALKPDIKTERAVMVEIVADAAENLRSQGIKARYQSSLNADDSVTADLYAQTTDLIDVEESGHWGAFDGWISVGLKLAGLEEDEPVIKGSPSFSGQFETVWTWPIRSRFAGEAFATAAKILEDIMAKAGREEFIVEAVIVRLMWNQENQQPNRSDM